MCAADGKQRPLYLVTSEDELRAAAGRLRQAERIAVDIESNGLFKYRATLCTIQLATPDEIVIVDAIATPLFALAELLAATGPRKIVHDVAYDARILAETSLVLGNVLDTSIAARMLGRTASGLASLLGSELGIALDKGLQRHDWTERPIRDHQLRYLAGDVAHLHALAAKLGAEIDESSEESGGFLRDAIEEETRYRLAQAASAAKSVDPRPPYVRLKGIERAPKEELPILRRLAELREQRAKNFDVPPYKVIGADVLFAIAKARPRTPAELRRVKGMTGRHAQALGGPILEAVAAGMTEGRVPDDERRLLERPRLPPAIVKARRARESRLTSWRKARAKERGVDEQVILPGHCLQDLADLDDGATLASIAAVPGIGAFRVERDGVALLATLLSSTDADRQVRAPAAAAIDIASEPSSADPEGS